MIDKIYPGLVFFIGLLAFHPSTKAQSLLANQQKEGVLISENSQPVLFYQRQEKSQNGRPKRANYIHPLYGFEGEVLTEDFPEDHPHHRGIFWVWHQIILYPDERPTPDI